MVGITRIATYFPRRRLDRALVAKAWGTRVPVGVRTVAGIDEDALTMAADAVFACLDGADPAGPDALYFASASSPYREKQVASIVATAADLRRDVAVADVAGSVRAGLTALRLALDGVGRERPGGARRGGRRPRGRARVGARAASRRRRRGGAVGSERVVAELVASASVAEEFTYLWRTDEQRYVQASEPRFGAKYGYVRDMAEAIGAALRRAELPPGRVARLALAAPDARARRRTRRRPRLRPGRQLVPSLVAEAGSSAPRSRSRSSRARSRRRRRATSSSSPPGARAPTRSSSARRSDFPPRDRGPSPTASRAASRSRRTSAISARAACCPRSRSASPSPR
jgi:hypothetical protein